MIIALARKSVTQTRSQTGENTDRDPTNVHSKTKTTVLGGVYTNVCTYQHIPNECERFLLMDRVVLRSWLICRKTSPDAVNPQVAIGSRPNLRPPAERELPMMYM